MRLLLVFLFVGLSSTSFAQSDSLTLVNNTDCYFFIKVNSVNSDCDSACANAICVMPQDSIAMAPCGSATHLWEAASIIPVTSSCEPCGADYASPRISNPFGHGCSPYPSMVSNQEHCGDCVYTAFFVGGYKIRIN